MTPREYENTRQRKKSIALLPLYFAALLFTLFTAGPPVHPSFAEDARPGEVDFWANAPEKWDCLVTTWGLVRSPQEWHLDPVSKRITAVYRTWKSVYSPAYELRVESFNGRHLVLSADYKEGYHGVFEGDLNGKSIRGTAVVKSSTATEHRQWKATWTGADNWPVKYAIAETEAAKKAVKDKEQAETIASMAEKIAVARIDAVARQISEEEKKKQELLRAEEKKNEQVAAVNRPVKDKWALIIGISKFADSSVNLRYAAKDAQDFRDYLVKEANFAPDHVRLLVDSQASRERILDEFGDSWLPRVVGPDDLVVIYISTHGTPADRDVGLINYLVAFDTDKNKLFSRGIPMQELCRLIKGRVRSDRILIIMDACFSPNSKGLFQTGNFSAQEIAQGTGQLVICSSETNQRSWESNRFPNGIFTKNLIDSLRRNGNRTTLGDAFSYLREQVEEEVRREHGALQTPCMNGKWQGSDLILALPPSAPRPGLPEPVSKPAAVPTSTTKSPAGKPAH